MEQKMKLQQLKSFAKEYNHLDLFSLVEDCVKESVAFFCADDFNESIAAKIKLNEAKENLLLFLKNERNSRIVEDYLIELCSKQLMYLWSDKVIGTDLKTEIKECKSIVGERMSQYYMRKVFTYNDHQLILKSTEV